MMIGVMSDSHDNLPRIRAALKRLAAEEVEVLLHAGDFVAPFAVREILTFPRRVIGVFGNNDGERAGIRALWPEVNDPPFAICLDGKNILMTHDRARVKQEDLKGVDILIYGHNHKPSITTEDGVLCVNPGECGGWLSGKATVAIIDTATMQARIIEVL